MKDYTKSLLYMLILIIKNNNSFNEDQKAILIKIINAIIKGNVTEENFNTLDKLCYDNNIENFISDDGIAVMYKR